MLRPTQSIITLRVSNSRTCWEAPPGLRCRSSHTCSIITRHQERIWCAVQRGATSAKRSGFTPAGCGDSDNRWLSVVFCLHYYWTQESVADRERWGGENLRCTVNKDRVQSTHLPCSCTGSSGSIRPAFKTMNAFYGAAVVVDVYVSHYVHSPLRQQHQYCVTSLDEWSCVCVATV